MNILQDVQRRAVKNVKTRPVIKPGYTVRVHQKIKEGSKERIQIFEGLVIAINSGHGADKTFKVRRLVQGIGVEKTFPLYSTLIEKIDIVKKSKVRRSKLYYMRERTGKSARLKASFMNEEEMENIFGDEVAEEKAPTETKEESMKEEAAEEKATEKKEEKE